MFSKFAIVSVGLFFAWTTWNSLPLGANVLGEPATTEELLRIIAANDGQNAVTDTYPCAFEGWWNGAMCQLPFCGGAQQAPCSGPNSTSCNGSPTQAHNENVGYPCCETDFEECYKDRYRTSNPDYPDDDPEPFIWRYYCDVNYFPGFTGGRTSCENPSKGKGEE